jgi:hypothetical protein
MVLSAAAVFALAYSASAQTSTSDTGATGDKKMAQTTETKSKMAGMKATKTKGKTVIGTVKSYDAGKKIVVTGPKNKDWSFDLDDANVAATVDPAVAVGNKVKAVQATDDAGKKTLTVSPYTAPMHHKKSMKKSSSTSSPSSK